VAHRGREGEHAGGDETLGHCGGGGGR
jgi:hypothetical protein